MTEGTRFWVVRPRVGAGWRLRLGTLLSGAYIGFDPGQRRAGERVHRPGGAAPDPSDVAGRRFQLHADQLGSADARLARLLPRSEVGQVLGYALDDTGALRHARDLRGRAARPAGARQQPVLERERDRRLGRRGRRQGRRSSRRPARRRDRLRHAGERPSGRARPRGHGVPALREHRRDRAALHPEGPTWIYFDGPCAACSPGAPVEFRGMVGRLRDRRQLEIDPEQDTVRIPMTLGIEPARVDARRRARRATPT